MKCANTKIYNFEGALHGMRNPLNSWAKSDSECNIGNMDDLYDAESDVVPCWIYNEDKDCSEYDEEYENKYQKYSDWLENNGILKRFADTYEFALIGPNDMALAQRLINSGPEHCKFLRQIFVSVDITAPLYWWKEFDTYKVGTTANSTSTMHTITSTPFTRNMFEFDDGSLEIPDENDPFNPYIYEDFIEAILDRCEMFRQLYLNTKDKRYWRALIQILPEAFLQTRTVTMSYANLRNIYFQRKDHKLVEWHEFCDWIKSLPYAEELITLGEDK